MTTYLISVDDFSLISTIASLILALVAIWLSVVFYRLSTLASKETTAAAEKISSNVERLESLFNRLYNDNFSLLRETFVDMRSRVWSSQDDADPRKRATELADEKINGMRSAYAEKVSKLVKDQALPEERARDLVSEIQKVLEQAISGTRTAEVEALTGTIKDFTLATIKALLKTTDKVLVQEVVGILSANVAPLQVIDALTELRDAKIISLTPDAVAPNSKIRLG